MYDGLYTFVVRLVAIALAAALTILTARMLGPAGRGVYALPGVEAVLVASIFGGLGSATSYFLLTRNPSAAFLRTVLYCAALWVVIAAAALVPLALLGRAQWTLAPAMAVLPAMALLNVATGYALGMKKVRYTTAIAAIQNLLTVCATAAGLFLISRTPGVAIVAWVLGTTLTGIVALTFVVIFSRRRAGGTEEIGLREYAQFCMKVSVTYVVSLLNYRADLYIVALLLTPAALGMYGIAINAAESLLIPTQAAALAASPHIASLELRQSALLTARCVRNNLLIALAVCGLLFIFARPIILLLYGPAFLPAVPAFDVLLAGVVALSLGSPVSNYFTLRLGRPQVPMWLGTLSAAICIGFSFALIGRYGMIGAAVGSTVGYIVGQGAGLWYFGRQTRIGAREMLVPTSTDFHTYAAFAARVLKDGRRLIQPSP